MEFFATNAPDPPHWTLHSIIGAFRSVSVHLAMFNYYTKLVAKMVELVQLSRIGIFRNERTRSTPLDPKLKYWFVFILFGFILDLICYYTKLGAKRIELVQLMKKFAPRNRIRVFRNERTRSSPLDAKLMNQCVL